MRKLLMTVLALALILGSISVASAASGKVKLTDIAGNASVLVGQWPANYVALDRNLTLYANVGGEPEMNKASAAQMIYNVLTKQLVQVDANSTVKYLYDDNSGTGYDGIEQTLLTTNLDCSRDPQIRGKKIINEGDVDASKINLLPYVGAYGVLYKSNADDEVVAVTDVETKFLAGRFVFDEATGDIDYFQGVDGSSYTLSKNSPDSKIDRWSPSRIAQSLNTVDGDLTMDNEVTGAALFVNGDTMTHMKNTDKVYPNGGTDRCFFYDSDGEIRALSVGSGDAGAADVFVMIAGIAQGRKGGNNDTFQIFTTVSGVYQPASVCCQHRALQARKQ
jgi:hypothetical protein